MPELPEVETVRRGLAQRLVGRRVLHVAESGKALRGGASPVPLRALVGRRFIAADRHAKFLLLRLDDAATLVVHLGMSGKLLFAAPDDPLRPHTHVRIALDDGAELRFVDPRRFGSLRLHPPNVTPPELAHYGIDALDPALDEATLAGLLAGSRAPVKAFLLDQTKIAGLGNIYALEALWRARLSPRRVARNVPRARIALLLEAIRGVLEDSLAQGGTTFNDYVDSIGAPGGNLPFLSVFRRAGEPCPRCGATIKRIVQGGRSSFYCPRCQR